MDSNNGVKGFDGVTNLIYLPVIMQSQPTIPFALGCQIEGHVGNRAQWVVPRRQYQIGVKWRDVVTSGWGAYDPDFAALAGHRITVGVKVVPESVRLWPGYVSSPPKPSYYDDLGYFINSMLTRYPDIEAVELFNEPDVDRDTGKEYEEFFGAWCINDGWYAGGQLYGQCLATVYPIVHAAYPEVRVIAGALMAHGGSLQFLDGALAGGLKADAISFHKYIGLGGNFNAAFEFGTLVRNKTPLAQVLSETSITALTDSDALKQAQADYLAHLRQSYINSTVDVIQWYTLANNGWDCSDLVRNSVPTPAYDVFKEEL